MDGVLAGNRATDQGALDAGRDAPRARAGCIDARSRDEVRRRDLGECSLLRAEHAHVPIAGERTLPFFPPIDARYRRTSSHGCARCRANVVERLECMRETIWCVRIGTTVNVPGVQRDVFGVLGRHISSFLRRRAGLARVLPCRTRSIAARRGRSILHDYDTAEGINAELKMGAATYGFHHDVARYSSTSNR